MGDHEDRGAEIAKGGVGAAAADAEAFGEVVEAIEAVRSGDGAGAAAHVGSAVHHAVEALEETLEAAGAHLGPEAQAAMAAVGAAGQVVEHVVQAVQRIEHQRHARDEHRDGQCVEPARDERAHAPAELRDVHELVASIDERDVRLEIEIDLEVMSEWKLVRLDVEETLGKPYRARALVAIEVRPSAGVPLASPQHLLGAEACARIYRGARARAVHGITAGSRASAAPRRTRSCCSTSSRRSPRSPSRSSRGCS